MIKLGLGTLMKKYAIEHVAKSKYARGYEAIRGSDVYLGSTPLAAIHNAVNWLTNPI